MPGKGIKRKNEGLSRTVSRVVPKTSGDGGPTATVAVATADTPKAVEDKLKGLDAERSLSDPAVLTAKAAATAEKDSLQCDAFPIGCGKLFASPQRKKQHQHAGNAPGAGGQRPCGERAADLTVPSLEEVENKRETDGGVVKSVTELYMFTDADPRKQTGDNEDDVTYSVIDAKTGRYDAGALGAH